MDPSLSRHHGMLITTAAIAMALSVILSAFETSMTSADRLKMKVRAGKGGRIWKKISDLADDYDVTISSIMILMNASHALYAALASFIISDAFGQNALAVGTLLSGVFIFLAGEMLPKLIALAFKDSVLVITSILCMPLLTLISPASKLLGRTAKAIIGLLVKNSEDESAMSEEDIKAMAENASKTGAIDPDTKELIEHALGFDDKPVSSVMIPWSQVSKLRISSEQESLDGDPAGRGTTCDIHISGTEDLLSKVNALEFTRYPAITEKGDVLGVINVRIFLQKYLRSERKASLYDSIFSPLPISPHMKVDDCLKELSRNKTHLGFVKDGSNGISGIITMEDIIEELIGDVDDEKTIKRTRA